jgi:predicted ATPase
MKKYVLTGGPSAGKTAILQLAARPGIYTIGEVSTYVIGLERLHGGSALPWTDRDAFQKKVLKTQLEWENEIPAGVEKVILDRGVPDGIAYYLMDGLEPPKELLDAAKAAKYDGIFIVEQLDSYEKTDMRREGRELANALHRRAHEVYESLGYKPISVPVMPRQERADWVLGQMMQN